MMLPNKGAANTTRIGVFEDVPAAERAVVGLIQAGFHRDQISVLCSDEAKEQHFLLFKHDDQVNSDAAESAAVGGLLGGLLGGLVSIGVTTAAGLTLVAAGPSFLFGGAIVGGLIGAMQTRGHEGPLADFYDQAISQGKILVAASDESGRSREQLQAAERVFQASGAIPIKFPEPTSANA